MKRVHLFEFHDRDWLPSTLRDLFTDLLSHFAARKNLYAPVADLLAPMIEMSHTLTLVDLCSGGAVPILTVINAMDESIASKIEVILTDKYPNLSAFARISEESGGKIGFIDQPVDATNVPKDLRGFRTSFGSFHHFKEESALAILSDAVNQNQGIGIFEFTDRHLLLRLVPFFVPLQVWLLLNALLIPPFRWQRIVWTYLIPILPLMILWDGVVSCLRSYSESELCALIEKCGDCGYSWNVGRRKRAGPFRITYLIGYPLRGA